MKLKLILLSAALAANICPSKADEGMWLLPTLKENESQMKALGLQIDVEDIYNPDSVSLKDAVVIFGGGCTGEIISPEGLLLTNHHCGYESIQQLSSVDHNYLQHGFWAANKQQELPAPDLTVQFIDKIEDVTDYVNTALEQDTVKDDMKYLSYRFLNNLAEKLVGKEYLNKNPWIEVEIKPLYGGNKYYLYVTKTYSDIRLVGTPPSSIGKFGADTDNWMWPRHTGDFSIFRVYTDKQGNPAEYSPENVPLKPKKYFNISTKELQDNDLTMVMGFPGRTNRFYTSWEVEQRKNITNRLMIDIRGLLQKEMLQEMRADEKVNIQYASKYAGSSNYWKNAIGMNRGIDQLDLIQKKRDEEKQFTKWALKSNKPQYIEALKEIENVTKEQEDFLYQITTLVEALYYGVEFTQVPFLIDNLTDAIKVNDTAKIHRLTDDLRTSYEAFANKDYNRNVDKRVSKIMLKAYADKIPADKRPEYFKTIDKKYKGNYDEFVDAAFKKSIFGSDKNFNKFIKRPNAITLEKDPMILWARSILKKRLQLIAEMQSLNNRFSKARKTYIEGLLKMKDGEKIYPDANFTIRLTYGQILPYNPKDGATYHTKTTLKGVMEKEDSTNWEFEVPAKLKELYENKDYGTYGMANGEMPCCFISNNDITGGNSGSPVLNANGELIGAAFDGNWEAMSGDIVFEPDLQRTISVDIRYVLFIIEKYAGAKHLIDEMTIIK